MFQAELEDDTDTAFEPIPLKQTLPSWPIFHSFHKIPQTPSKANT